jgi:hypothetical protein
VTQFIWPPENRFNIDQVPFNFSEGESTHDFAGGKRIWIASHPTHNSKRFGTLQICVRLKNEMPGKSFAEKQTLRESLAHRLFDDS